MYVCMYVFYISSSVLIKSAWVCPYVCMYVRECMCVRACMYVCIYVSLYFSVISMIKQRACVGVLVGAQYAATAPVGAVGRT